MRRFIVSIAAASLAVGTIGLTSGCSSDTNDRDAEGYSNTDRGMTSDQSRGNYGSSGTYSNQGMNSRDNSSGTSSGTGNYGTSGTGSSGTSGSSGSTGSSGAGSSGTGR